MKILATLKALSIGKKIALGALGLFAFIGFTGSLQSGNQNQQPLNVPSSSNQAQVIKTNRYDEADNVRVKTEKVAEEISYQATTENDATLEIGKSVVSVQGVAGVREITYEVSYSNGLEIGRKEVSSAVVKQPINQITKVGTKQKPASGSVCSGGYINSSGNCVKSPGSNPAGATARCRDGTYSYSQSRRGTCSHHGGVAEWL